MAKYLAHLPLNLPSDGPFWGCDQGFVGDPHDRLNWEICNRPRASFWGARSPATARSPHGYAPLESFATA